MDDGTNKKKSPPKIDLSQPESLRQLDLDTLIGIISRLYEQNLQLSEILQDIAHSKHGRKTETFIDSNQLSLFPESEASSQIQADTEKAQEGEEQKSGKRKGSSRQRNPRPSNVNRVVVPAKTPSPEDLICKCCGKSLVKINQIVLHSRYDYRPASICIQDIVEDIFACPGCDASVVEAAETAGLVNDASSSDEHNVDLGAALVEEIAAVIDAKHKIGIKKDANKLIAEAAHSTLSDIRVAANRIARCEATPAILGYIVVSKYCDHLPLNRIEQIFARHGASINRSTMCGWLALIADLMRSIYDYMHQKLLESKVIKTDDTPVKVKIKKGSKKIRTGRIWVYIGDNEHPVTLFQYTQGRGREGPKTFLKGFRRYLQGDCFSGNLAICAESGATFVACRAHGRRYFKKALLNYKLKSEEALRFEQQLFKIESDAKELGLKPEDVKLMREQESKPILEEYKIWLDKECRMALPKSAFGKAVNYNLNNWEHLSAYLLDGDLSIDNNLAEQEMKRIAMGRKAWLFFGSENGGENAEVLFSLIATCKRHGVEPYAYLVDVIRQLMINPETSLEKLLPYNWKKNTDKSEITGCHTNPIFAQA